MRIRLGLNDSLTVLSSVRQFFTGLRSHVDSPLVLRASYTSYTYLGNTLCRLSVSRYSIISQSLLKTAPPPHVLIHSRATNFNFVDSPLGSL
jgi:hypothetical protein